MPLQSAAGTKCHLCPRNDLKGDSALRVHISKKHPEFFNVPPASNTPPDSPLEAPASPPISPPDPWDIFAKPGVDIQDILNGLDNVGMDDSEVHAPIGSSGVGPAAQCRGARGTDEVQVEGGGQSRIYDSSAAWPLEVEDCVDAETGRLPDRLQRRLSQLERLRENKDDRFFPFPGRWAVELAIFLYCDVQLSEKKTNHLLKLLGAISGFSSPFTSYQHMVQLIDGLPFLDVPFQEVTITPERYAVEAALDDVGETGAPPEIPPFWKEVSFRYRDPLDVVEHLLSRTDLGEHFHSKPFQIYNSRGDRVVSNYFSANKVRRIQDMLEPGVLQVPLICASDETLLSNMCGDKAAYPVYLTLGNFSNAARLEHRKGTSILLAYLPILKVASGDRTHKTYRRFVLQMLHQCLETIFSSLRDQPASGTPLVCPDGQIRSAYVVLASWVADYKEMIKLAFMLNMRCALCTVPWHLTGDGIAYPNRSSEEALRLRKRWMTKEEEHISGYLNGKCFTDDLPLVDNHQLYVSDLLHQVAKPLKDHLAMWCLALLERSKKKDAFMRRFPLVPHFSGLKHFTNGIEFHGWQGEHSKSLSRIFKALCINSGLPDSAIRAVSAYIDMYTAARRPKHSIPMTPKRPLDVHFTPPIPGSASSYQGPTPTTTFEELESAQDGYRANLKTAFDSVARSWRLPRAHSTCHLPRSVLDVGALSANSSDTWERQHIKDCKEPYRRSNKHNEEAQMLASGIRTFRLEQLTTYLTQAGEPSFLEWCAQCADEEPREYPTPIQKIQQEWKDGLISYPHAVMAHSSSGKPRIARDVAVQELLPEFPNELARFLTHLFRPHEPVMTRVSKVHLFEAAAINLRCFHSMTLFSLPPDPTLDPYQTSVPIKSTIRANPRWKYNDMDRVAGLPLSGQTITRPRYDHIIYQATNQPGIEGFGIGRVRLLFRVEIRGKILDLAYVEEYTRTRTHGPTGLQILRHKFVERFGARTRSTSVIPLKSIISSAHIIPVFPEGDMLTGWTRWNAEEKANEFVLNTDIDVAVRDIMNPHNY